MVNIITGIIAMTAAFVFLGFYMSRIHAVVFWVVVIGVMALALTDLLKSIREEIRSRANSNHNSS